MKNGVLNKAPTSWEEPAPVPRDGIPSRGDRMSYAGPSWKKLSAIPAEGEANLLARRTRTREQSCSPVMLEPARNEARCNRRNTPPSFEPGSSRGVKGVTIFHVTTVGAPWNESGGAWFSSPKVVRRTVRTESRP